jgi:hypothetical protein
MRQGKLPSLTSCGTLISWSYFHSDHSSDPEGIFDIPKFEGTVFAKGYAGKGESGPKEDGSFVN